MNTASARTAGGAARGELGSGSPNVSRRAFRRHPARQPAWRVRATRFGQRLRTDEAGAVTAEYALVIMAAVAFAGVLIVIMRSEEVRSTLVALVENALGSAD